MAARTASRLGTLVTTEYYRAGPVVLLFVDRLPVFKALGDNTRYAIYLELARSAVPLSTAEVAEPGPAPEHGPSPPGAHA
jgi:hypothetical protein